MRQVKSLADVQIVLNQLLDWQTDLQTKNQNLHKLKITNAAPGTDPNDYITLSQLPTAIGPTKPQDQHYTIVFSNDGVITAGALSPPFRVAVQRAGIPTQIWVEVIGAPTADATFNVQCNGINLLSTSLKLAAGLLSAQSSTFTIPVQQMAEGSRIVPVILVGGNAAQVSIGVVVKRTIAQ